MDQEYTPQHEKDNVVDDLINKLLKSKEFEEQEKRFDPYSLDTKKPLKFEAKSDHGVHELKPAYKKTKPAYTSMFEVEMMRLVGDEAFIYPSTANNRQYIKVVIPGVTNKCYLKLSAMHRLQMHDSEIRSTEKGVQFIVTFIVDRDFLRENCIRAK